MNELDGHYLTFELAGENYAISIHNAKEVMDMVNITQVPAMPPFIIGVINLRGMVIPVMDLRAKFGLDEDEKSLETSSIIILEIKNQDNLVTMGCIADEVHEVIDLSLEKMESVSSLGFTMGNDYISGMCQYNDSFLIVLDIEKVLLTDEIIDIPITKDLIEEENSEEEPDE